MKILEKTVSNISSRKIKVNNECIYYLDKKLQSKKYFYEKIKIKLIQNSSDEIIYAGLIYQYTITTIAINMKSNYISIKNYRYSGFEIETFIFSNSEDSFTGKDLELIISVYYDKKEKEILNLHKIYLPNLETEIILNHESLMAKKDEGKKYKLFTHGRNYFLLFKYGKNLILICFDQNLKIISESEIQENFFIEYFKIFEIDKKLYLVFCSIDKFLNVYKINDQNSKMVFYNKFQIPTENLILPDYKIINFPKEIFLILNNSSLFKIDLIKNIISFVKNSENILGYCDQQREIFFETLLHESVIYEDRKIITCHNEFINHKLINDMHSEIFCKLPELKVDKTIKIKFTEGLNILEIFEKLNLVIFIGSKTLAHDYKDDKILLETSETVLNFYYDEKLSELVLFLSQSINIFKNNKKDIQKIKYPVNGFKDIFVSPKENINFILIQDKFFYLNAKKEIKEICENTYSALIDELHDEIFKTKENIFSKFNNSLFSLNKKSMEFKYFVLQNFKICSMKITFNENNLGIDDIKHNDNNIFILAKSYIKIFNYKIEKDYFQTDLLYVLDFQYFSLLNMKMKIYKVNNNFNFITYNKNKNNKVHSIISFNHEKKQLKIFRNFMSGMNIINLQVTDSNSYLYSISQDKITVINIYTNPLNTQDIILYKNTIVQTFLLESILKQKLCLGKFLIIYTRSIQINDNLEENNKFTLHILDVENSYTSILKLNIEESLIEFDILNSNNGFILILMIKNRISKEKVLISLKFESCFNYGMKKYLFTALEQDDIQNKNDNENDFIIKIDPSLEKINSSCNFIMTNKKVFKIDNILFTSIKIIQDLKMLLLFSNYGFLKFYNLDENLNLEEFYDSCYSSHLLEISNLKKEYENSEDLVKIFKEDDELNFLESYEFIDCFTFKNYTSKLNTNSEYKDSLLDYQEDYIFLILNFGIIIFKLTTDTFTSSNMIKFYQQLSFESKLEAKIYKSSNIIEESVFIKFENFNHSLKFENDKFLLI
jgi:hypothetical protein